MYGAAKRYQYYVQHEDRYGYHAGTLNYIQYNPDASCGGSNVYIENKATALLYIYTPYQPNAAALDAGVGEGDACSTYGNRNFAIIYNSMFGSPRADFSIQLLMEGTDQKEPFMGLLNNNNYIDPFKVPITSIPAATPNACLIR